MSDHLCDPLLDRINELLELCRRADKTGRGVVSTAAIREVFAPRALHPAARYSEMRRR
jgi:hypothetical protein